MSGFSPRSVLFVPGHRPDMLAKVARGRPDGVIVGLVVDAVHVSLARATLARIPT